MHREPFHHIMVRGINKTEIFSEDKRQEDVYRTIERCRYRRSMRDLRLGDHGQPQPQPHSLQEWKAGISEVMRKVLTWYAQYYNRCHNRTGHLFENRYKSILCDEERYLLALVRYIHLNPIRVRAKVVVSLEELDKYPWTGHQTIIGKEKNKSMDPGLYLRSLEKQGASDRGVAGRL